MNYPKDFINKVICGDCLKVMKKIPENSIDLVVTDPPYGLFFMGKDWDRVVPMIEIWKECLRVLKPGAFAFIMSGPRQDVLSQMIIRLDQAGFNTGFTSIYWTYASGFPKATNIGKMVDKRLGVKREVIGKNPNVRKSHKGHILELGLKQEGISKATSNEAKFIDGSYSGFQPKPAVELILVCMKPLSEKTYVNQALKNRKGVTWLDDCRIPIQKGDKPQGGYGAMDIGIGHPQEHQDYRKTTKRQPRRQENVFKENGFNSEDNKTADADPRERFPANLLVSNNVLNNKKVTISTGGKAGHAGAYQGGYKEEFYKGVKPGYGDIGFFSRYFDLDKWAVKKDIKDTFPFLICPKASKGEKNRGCGMLKTIRKCRWSNAGEWKNLETEQYGNIHPTVKPVKLMSYLITLGSRPKDMVLDPFIGSGTVGVAAKQLYRNFIGIEKVKKYCEIAECRLKTTMSSLF